MYRKEGAYGSIVLDREFGKLGGAFQSVRRRWALTLRD
jgi:hypothetical protein